ncbi:MAG: ATP-dependent chaperone ClpB [Cytophagales bacterium]|nr:MAG: ATP-dependent chaperone ClpB [Cytophagales bacterium]
MNFNQYTIKAQEVVQHAAQMAQGNGQQTVETGHVLKAILEEDPNTVGFLARKVGTDSKRLTLALDAIVNGYPKVVVSGTTDQQGIYLGNDLNAALQRAQTQMKDFGDEYVSVEMMLLGLVGGKDTVATLLKDIGFAEKTLKEAIRELRGKNNPVKDQNAEATYQSLERYGVNLNKRASEGKIDPVIGRDEEIRRVLQILSRRTKNNPMLLGEPGVGKTAIVEGLAQRIVQGDVPENLKSKTIMSLDMGLLVAGAKYKGEFEERLKSVIKEVTDSEGEIVLFIDEIHTLIGAGGGGEGAMDAANLLKPALARGELHAIGATTLKEYQKYIEKDKALERRFQSVLVDEPDVPDAISILRGIKERYELHHGVRIKDDAVIAAVELSNRYISDRFLPDKAIDLMDEAAAKLRLEIDSVPEELDELNRRIMQLEIEREAIRREDDKEKESVLSRQIADLNETRTELRSRWESEKESVNEGRTLKEQLDHLRTEAEQAERAGDYGKVAEIRYGRIPEMENRLKQLANDAQTADGSDRMLQEEVTSEDIAEVVAKWTGIPVSRMLQSERDKLLYLEAELGKRVAGQEEAIEVVADAVRRSRAGMQDPKRPIGSFLFLGTTGVGKTELAKALAEFLFNDENNLVRIDMSEYQERHSASRLIGAPPGYVGYDEGGQLTEAVRRKPYSVILLDEIEKAHPDVFNILLQVLDDGRLTDNKGRVANFKNTIIIMTSNMGSHIIRERFAEITRDNRTRVIEETKEEVFELLKQTLRPEFLNRIDELVMFQPLTRREIRKIMDIQFRQIQARLSEQGITLEAEPEVLDFIAREGFESDATSATFGARPLKRFMQRRILNALSKEILSGRIQKNAIVGMMLNEDENGQEDIIFYNLDKVVPLLEAE